MINMAKNERASYSADTAAVWTKRTSLSGRYPVVQGWAVAPRRSAGRAGAGDGAADVAAGAMAVPHASAETLARPGFGAA